MLHLKHGDFMNYYAFTSWCNGISNKLISRARIKSETRSIEVDALWDTGAALTCISKEVPRALKISPIGRTRMSSATGITIQKTYCVDIILPNGIELPGICVVDSAIGKQGIGLLIGMDIISKGDFAVSNFNERTVFTFRCPAKREIDFVEELVEE